jgi:hypothetical protein
LLHGALRSCIPYRATLADVQELAAIMAALVWEVKQEVKLLLS